MKMTAPEIIANSEAIIFDLFHTLASIRSDGTAGRNTNEILGIPEADWNRIHLEHSEKRLRYNDQDDVSIIPRLACQYDPSIPEVKIVEAARSRAARFRECLTNTPRPKNRRYPAAPCKRAQADPVEQCRRDGEEELECIPLCSLVDRWNKRYFSHPPGQGCPLLFLIRFNMSTSLHIQM